MIELRCQGLTLGEILANVAQDQNRYARPVSEPVSRRPDDPRETSVPPRLIATSARAGMLRLLSGPWPQIEAFVDDLSSVQEELLLDALPPEERFVEDPPSEPVPEPDPEPHLPEHQEVDVPAQCHVDAADAAVFNPLAPEPDTHPEDDHRPSCMSPGELRLFADFLERRGEAVGTRSLWQAWVEEMAADLSRKVAGPTAMRD